MPNKWLTSLNEAIKQWTTELNPNYQFNTEQLRLKEAEKARLQLEQSRLAQAKLEHEANMAARQAALEESQRQFNVNQAQEGARLQASGMFRPAQSIPENTPVELFPGMRIGLPTSAPAEKGAVNFGGNWLAPTTPEEQATTRVAAETKARKLQMNSLRSSLLEVLPEAQVNKLMGVYTIDPSMRSINEIFPTPRNENELAYMAAGEDPAKAWGMLTDFEKLKLGMRLSAGMGLYNNERARQQVLQTAGRTGAARIARAISNMGLRTNSREGAQMFDKMIGEYMKENPDLDPNVEGYIRQSYKQEYVDQKISPAEAIMDRLNPTDTSTLPTPPPGWAGPPSAQTGQPAVSRPAARPRPNLSRPAMEVR